MELSQTKFLFLIAFNRPLDLLSLQYVTNYNVYIANIVLCQTYWPTRASGRGNLPRDIRLCMDHAQTTPQVRVDTCCTAIGEREGPVTSNPFLRCQDAV